MDSCIDDGIMSGFLTKHKTEVISACMAKFEEEVFAGKLRNDGKIEEKTGLIKEIK